MTVTTQQAAATAPTMSPWHGFQTGIWQKEINVRDFIQQNYTPYEGDEGFLAGATPRMPVRITDEGCLSVATMC